MDFITIDMLDPNSGNLQLVAPLFSATFPGSYNFCRLGGLVEAIDRMADIVFPDTDRHDLAYRITET